MMTRPASFLQAHPLAAVLVTALIVRLAILLALPGIFAFQETDAVHGSAAYDTYARYLLQTGVYGKITPGVPDAHLPPLYSYAVALVYGLFGRTHYATASLNILLDLFSISAVYLLARLIFSRAQPPVLRHVPVIAALAYALYPYLIFQNLTLIDTPLFMALLNGFVLMVALLTDRAAMDRRALLLGVIAGVLLGLGTLTRANTPLFALAVVPYVWMMRGFRAAVIRLLPVALVSVLVVLPWIVRNYQVFGGFVPVALNGGENFYQGNNAYTVPYFQAGYDVQWVPPPAGMDFDDPYGIEANQARLQAGLTYLRENPAAIPELLWTKLGIHWSIDVQPLRNPTAGDLERLDYVGDVRAATDGDGLLTLGDLPPGDPVDAYSDVLFDQVGRTIHALYFGVMAGAALGFLLTQPRWWRAVSLIVLTQVANTLNYVIFHPSTRYRVPTDPLLFILSAAGLALLTQALATALHARERLRSRA
ncbi:hypothetical protein FBR02_02410 [Anaerolineae bacterium CFX9]|nr:hypothetical protein [Anaerolineae bacterium CFX9]